MEISNDKISELLKNPEIVGMIANLASGFSVKKPDLPAEEEPVSQEVSPEKKEENTELVPQQTVIPSELASMMPQNRANPNSDRRIALLEAIKPYISSSKQSKVDGLVKAIGVAGILNSYTGGIVENMFDRK